jgi:CRISPR-associated protein (TIGR02710 family)
MLKKLLILTVGTGTRPDVNIVKPLLKTIKDSSPQFIGFVTSEESHKFSEEIIRQLDLSSQQFDILTLSDSENLESIYSCINKWISSLVARGYSPQEITVDFTSGTKAMTSGAVLASVARGCAGLKYISGKRKNGVVQDGTETFITVQPNTVFAHRQIEIGKNLINEFRFDSATSIFSSVNRALLDEGEMRLLDGYINVSNAYDCWDRFMQNRVDGYLSKVSDGLKELDIYRIPKEIRQRLIDIYKAQEKEEVTEDMLADLFNNAQRRFSEGKFDDATARLYRLVEMLAQMVLLKEHQIKTWEVPEGRIPGPLRKNFEESRDPKDGRIKIGLKKSYVLLNGLGNPLGEKYLQNKRISGLLKQRNDSFLAHGTKPISSEACQGLFEEARILLKKVIPNFDQICKELQFPW